MLPDMFKEDEYIFAEEEQDARFSMMRRQRETQAVFRPTIENFDLMRAS